MIFGVGQRARLCLKHYRNTITDRKGKPITSANELRMI